MAADVESQGIELGEKEGGLERSSEVNDSEYASLWAAIERMETFERLRSSLFDEEKENGENGKRVVDVTKLGAQEHRLFIQKLIKHIEADNLQLLSKLRSRIDKVGVKFPTVEVRYKNLRLEVECEVVHGKPLPTLWNSLISTFSGLAKLAGAGSHKAQISIFDDVSGDIKPGRLTLLLGPPGCGKTSLLKALSGNLSPSLKLTGEVSYNGYKLEEFIPQKTSAYISQTDLHTPEMTVRETLDFSARCQGVGSRAEIMMEVSKREEAGIVPDPDIDTYMKAISVKGLKETLQTEYIMKITGLDICADTLVGDAMKRGISGGQKKRLTTGEIIVGPTKTWFMDEVTNGLDSSTAYQIISCLQQRAHVTDATIMISLLQPAPETFNLFDDLILMSEGRIVYHGPCAHVLEFFEYCGFRCPERKGIADFLQEVISKKDQAQYWFSTDKAYKYISVDVFCKKFKASRFGKKLDEELLEPYDKSQSHNNAISFSKYSLSKWELLKACMSREVILMRRHSVVYISKITQLIIMALITMTVFLRTRMEIDILNANYYMGVLFFGLIMLVLDGITESTMTVQALGIFYKQKALCFYPAWAYAIPATVLKVPLSVLEALFWTSLTYYVIGFSPEIQRFFYHFFMLFAVHLAAVSLFRFMASVCQTMVVANTVGVFVLLLFMLLSGFVITQSAMPVWLRWGSWFSPLTYGEIGLALNEFLSPRWQKMLNTNTTIGQEALRSRGLNFEGYFYWVAVGALLGFAIIFNIGYILALSYLKAPGSSSTLISHENLSKLQITEDSRNGVSNEEESTTQTPQSSIEPEKGRMVLPFTPLTVVFQDVQYYIETPLIMKERGFAQKRLQLLTDITGFFRPGILTALMGVSGAGKTTLLDVLSGRKTTGYIEGEIKIGGYPKVQETFARVSGYCEQTDIHSPHITVEESVIFSAWMRLDSQIDSKKKADFVNEVLETIELGGVKDSIVGTPGVSGLSNEQRKRLTIAVELVSNPSIIFMDEPTTGLDARSAAIVMRAVKNVADTGRTIVCTIHQPSIDIFESFDELVLLKTGGHVIYSGPLGLHSSRVIKYFEGIPGVPKIKEKYNPATWILEVTSTSAEAEFGLDFAQIYRNSALYENNKEVVKQLSSPPPGSRDVHFPTRFSQNFWGQFKSCLWKQHLSYWRNPIYNLRRIFIALISALLFGALFLNQGQNIKNQQSLFNVLGSMYTCVVFSGIYNCASVFQLIASERPVMYRETFAGMYSSWAYSLAQVTIEVPYILIDAVIFVIVTYPMIGYYGTTYKVLWYFYGLLCSFLYFKYLGMMLVSVSPNPNIAIILLSFCSRLFNLFAGFLLPKPKIPKWWIWFYYLTPTSWSLNGMLTSQYGDIEKEIVINDGEVKPVSAFLKDYFGFDHHQLPFVAIVLLAYPFLFAFIFAFCIGKLNFQRR
ncbi:hypothetical protein UlMin_015163 [Ulmus minor]